MTDGNIADLEVLLGHIFRDKQFIFNALSHSSTKTDERPSNERMEFLGDSVLGTICAEALYRRYPDADEGELTRIKSAAVSRATLERVAMVMGLDRFILVGKGVRKKAIPSSLIGNLFEAIVGAIYLDSGLAAARKFVLRQLDVVMDEIVDDRAERNYKSMLQHFCQRELGGMPSYRVLREAGPAHSRNYEIAVVVKGEEVGRATAASKKEAEQGAARAALLHYKAIDEQPIETVRGAGTVLRVGPVKPKRKPRSRRSRRPESEEQDAVPKSGDRPAAQKPPASRPSTPRPPAQKPPAPTRSAPAPSTPRTDGESPDAPAAGERVPAHTPLREGESSRRSRGGRRRRGGRGRGGRGRGGQGGGAPDASPANGGNAGQGQKPEAPRPESPRSESPRPETPRPESQRRSDRAPDRPSESQKTGPWGSRPSQPRAPESGSADSGGPESGGRESGGRESGGSGRAPAQASDAAPAPATRKKAAKKAAKKASKKKAAKKATKKKAAKKATKKKAAKKASKKKAAKKSSRKPSGDGGASTGSSSTRTGGE